MADVEQPRPVASQPEIWPPHWARVVGFLTGIGLIGWETVIDQAEKLPLYGVAVFLLGFPTARPLKEAVGRMSDQ